MSKNDTQFLIQKIRTQYTEKELTEVETLKALDSRVKRPAIVFACIYGSLSAIIMGSGMSLVMTDLAQLLGLSDGLVPGIIIGVVGLALALTTYPIYKGILKRRKKKFGPEILRLSEKLLGN